MGLNVIALGGNAILENIPTDDAQKAVVQKAAVDIVKFIKSGEKVVICHGNGPQVGNLLIQQKAAESEKTPMMKLDTGVAMTEGSIGYWIQQAIQNELKKQGVNQEAVSVVTQVEVDPADVSFQEPSKPIGPFYSRDEAEMEMQKEGSIFKEDAGRGYRKVVASPQPKRIVEKAAIKALVAADMIPICAGGGGVPVIMKETGEFQGVEAVIDKDFSANVLAKNIQADRLIILTGVDNIYINFNQPNQQALEIITIADAEKYIAENQFAKGSMLPKIEAAIDFVKGQVNRETIITSIENLFKISDGAGTRIVQ
ncbi:carbamate kinase [Enterococcus sp. PF1-24]|uniref:carbamate kinase n=1 Tax=unclassified Enterococcus TaxID=2608891 RepID=UPI002472F8E3|nr:MULTISPECIES: carbamate kinase [unclassified Enterococcus]MDH6363525.1 carbamate kinase [Enterococcus sp. PFB1-1]MDH6400619.1 carbamate kinase [Enterococcus sp. PF1-24]